MLEREDPRDVLLYKKKLKWLGDTESEISISTGSLRRKSQWLSRYPKHNIEPLRGNIETRLTKLKRSSWHGAIFSYAALKRMGRTSENLLLLDWMVPAPGQGAIAVSCLESNEKVLAFLEQINHEQTFKLVSIERQFLNSLEGGCTAPIGALASISNNEVNFKGLLSSIDGIRVIEVSKSADVNNINEIGISAAQEVLSKGGKEIMDLIQSNEKASDSNH